MEDTDSTVNHDEIELRLSRFDYEESKINIYDYVLKNDNLEKTVQIIMKIIEKELEMEKINNLT